MFNPKSIGDLPSITVISSKDHSNLLYENLRKYFKGYLTPTNHKVIFENESILAADGDLKIVKDKNQDFVLVAPAIDLFLHPEDRVRLVDWLVQMASKGLKVVIGTYDTYTLQSVEAFVAKYKIEDIECYKATGSTLNEVEMIDIHKSLALPYMTINKIRYESV